MITFFGGFEMASNTQLEQRDTFDSKMEKFKKRTLLSNLDFQEIQTFKNFSIRRLAYWIKKQAKKLVMECMVYFKTADILNNKNQKISLSEKVHFC
jgi:ribosomal protein S6